MNQRLRTSRKVSVVLLNLFAIFECLISGLTEYGPRGIYLRWLILLAAVVPIVGLVGELSKARFAPFINSAFYLPVMCYYGYWCAKEPPFDEPRFFLFFLIVFEVLPGLVICSYARELIEKRRRTA